MVLGGSLCAGKSYLTHPGLGNTYQLQQYFHPVAVGVVSLPSNGLQHGLVSALLMAAGSSLPQLGTALGWSWCSTDGFIVSGQLERMGMCSGYLYDAE